jgi:cellulose synthase (UDP-forming)
MIVGYSTKVTAKKYGVKHFSRKGIKKYNQPTPPFKEKTKAGNVNAWLNHVKRRKYDFFVQLDIDHIPRPDYLNKTLGYFRDEQVAWVQAPSVYKNLNSWTARGAAEQELVLQGPLQMGFYGYSNTPFIIGSHCTAHLRLMKLAVSSLPVLRTT